MDEADFTLVAWLRKILIEWELDTATLSQMSHVPESVLKEYLALGDSGESLPSGPAALSSAVPLIAIFKNIRATYPDAKEQNEWLKRPNSVFDGFAPAALMSQSEESLAFVAYAVESGLRYVKADS